MYALQVRLVCMPYKYALYVCLTSTPYMYALHVRIPEACVRIGRDCLNVVQGKKRKKKDKTITCLLEDGVGV